MVQMQSLLAELALTTVIREVLACMHARLVKMTGAVLLIFS